jgi:hypothetical protein
MKNAFGIFVYSKEYAFPLLFEIEAPENTPADCTSNPDVPSCYSAGSDLVVGAGSPEGDAT